MSSDANIKGMLSEKQLIELVKNGEIETVLLVFTDHYGRFMGKRFDAEFFISEAMHEGGHACNYLLTVDMEMEPIQGYDYAGWQTGYGDFRLAPDWHTLRSASWLERTALIICNVLDEKTDELTRIAPRSILLQQIKQAADAGFSAMASSELEYYIFQDSYRTAAQQEYHRLQPAGWYIEDYHILQGTREEPFNSRVRRHLKNSGVPVETSKGEWGLGQHEMNVRYSDVLTMADRHCVYKQCLKEVADQMNISVTFMAKQEESQAGSSCHLHISLWNQDRNAFCGDKTIGAVKASDYFRWFLAGWIAHVPDMMVFYAPTINSYKRYQAGSWAPTRLGWSYDNRTAGFRVVGRGSALRIECRIPGADCNPYLAFAASLASGMDGIAQQMEPPEMFQGDIYAAQNLPRVPATLHDAVSLFDASSFASRALGEAVKKHYLHFYRTECELYDKAVTDWERKRYFERI
jgi:glutamine synthetase